MGRKGPLTQVEYKAISVSKADEFLRFRKQSSASVNSVSAITTSKINIAFFED